MATPSPRECRRYGRLVISAVCLASVLIWTLGTLDTSFSDRNYVVTPRRRPNRRGYYEMTTPSGSMKRPASATFDSADHYAVIWLDKEGKLKINESPSMQGQVFTPEVRRNFVATLRKWPKVDETVDTSFHSVKRPRGNTPDSATDDDRLESISDHCSPNGSGEMVALRIGETSDVISYYKRALEGFLLANCRVVAKALIKVIEPRKQVKHPYNGRAPRGSAPGSSRDPEKTKPEWWPSDVMHKEPDHLRKEYLIQLLLHIIRELRDWGITADKLKEVADDTRRSLKDPSRVEIIYEVLRVRRMEERFERGKVAASTVVHVMHGRKPKGIEKEPTQTTSNAVAEDTFAEGPVTPTSTLEEVVSAVTTHVEVMPEAPRCLYDSASQPILSTPVAAGILSTNSLVFDFSDSTLFPNSSPGQPCTGGPGNYITLGTPSYPQDIFSQVHYSAPITAHDVPPPYMYLAPGMTMPAE